jgi:transcriptional regulator with XRE-family HTH domain
MDTQKFAKKVRRERERLGLSIRKLALKADVDPVTVSNVEDIGLCTLTTLIKIAGALEKPPYWFLQ